jgi:hypothetical protein
MAESGNTNPAPSQRNAGQSPPSGASDVAAQALICTDGGVKASAVGALQHLKQGLKQA